MSKMNKDYCYPYQEEIDFFFSLSIISVRLCSVLPPNALKSLKKKSLHIKELQVTTMVQLTAKT